MFDQYDYQQYGTTTAAPKYAKQNEKPMPSREELLARNSFPSVNQNKHLDRMLGESEMRFLYLVLTVVLAITFMVTGDDIRSDIYTAAAFIMAYIEFRSKND